MKRVFILFAIGLFAAGVALADAPRVGVVTGAVFDPAGAPIPGATVLLISERGSESSQSDDEGRFKFAFVIPDQYTVRADLSGFQSAEGMIVVSAGGRAEVDLRLSEVTADEIVVTGESPLINKFDVSGGGTVEAKELEKIVPPQRWYLSLLQYFPGVTPSILGGAEGHDVEGTTSFHNIFYVDGVDTSFARWGGGSVLRLPNVSVGQLQMASSRADAEFSRATGGVTTMTVKSGSNVFHGDLALTFQNLDWNENYDAFPGEEPVDELDTRWEVAFGGPIVKDKLWFFASAADQGILAFRVLPSGSRLDNTVTLEPWVAKFDYRPAQSHSLSLTAADTPATFPYFVGSAEPESVADFEQGGEFATLRWSWAINDDLFLDTSLAYNETYDNRVPLATHEVDPSGPPWSPAANNDIAYLDLLTFLTWNYIQISRPGQIDHPREQGNLSLNWFAGSHDVKFGLDYQDTGWGDNTKAVPRIMGYGYNRDMPGGFAVPLLMDVYTGTADEGGVESNTETWALFVRDRFTVGNHWTFNLGLRVDDQSHYNDAGTEIFQSTDVTPRATAVYDVRGDSTLLVTAGAGRYTDWIPMDLAGRFNEVPSGRGRYTRSIWYAPLQDFILPTLITSVQNVASVDITPSYKDEISLGVDWAFQPNWALKTLALYKETRNPYAADEQVVDIDGEPGVGIVYENIPDAYLDRTSLSFVLRRRFRDNWSMTASYTWSETDSNCYTVYHSWCNHYFGEMRAITNDDGVPLSTVNRDGYVSNHLPHVFKARGNYLFPLGKGHSINLGGFATYQSGARWQLIENQTHAAPGVEPEVTETITVYLEPAGSRKLDDLYQIDLNASWQFPIAGRFSGSLLLEILNATNEQEQRFIGDQGMLAGDPSVGLTTSVIQAPRRYRALATLTF